MLVAVFAGIVRTGAAGADTETVVKLNVVDHALVPPEFFALARQ